MNIIELAKNAHRELVTKDYPGHRGLLDPWTMKLLERFAALVRAEREWVDLTDDEIAAIPFPNGFARAVIAAFKEKNK